MDSATWRVLKDNRIARAITHRGCRAGTLKQRSIRTVTAFGKYSPNFGSNIYHLQAQYDFKIRFSGAITPSWNMQIPLTAPPWEFQQSNLITIERAPMIPSFKPSLAIHFSLLNTRSLKNKAALLHEYIVDHKVDIMALTETWLSPGDNDKIEINETTPVGYVFKHVPRNTRGGGVAVVHRKSFDLKSNVINKFKSFEYMDITLKSSSKSIRIIVLYRPPPSGANGSTDSTFYGEFTTLLEELTPDCGSGNVLLAGDFNFHVDDANNAPAKRFLNLISSFDYTNHVQEATHKKNHTLDLLLTRSGDKIVVNTNVVDPSISDHFVVNCKLLLAKPSSTIKQVKCRNLNSIDLHCLCNDIKNSGIMETSSASLKDFAEHYERTLSGLLDTHAPVKKKMKMLRPVTPWFTTEIQKQKITRRRLERRWRNTRLTVHKQLYTEQCVVVNKLIHAAKTRYYADMIADCGSDQRELFKKVEKLFQGTVERQYPSCASSEELANKFADYFDNKINVIRDALQTKSSNVVNPLPDSISPYSQVKLESFTPTNVEELSKLTRKIAKKSCILDPIPAKIVKECLSDLLPIITKMVNISLDTATVPENLKCAVLDPRLKKESLSTDEYSSFRPISNLKFVSKCIEKVVAAQICHHITSNNMGEPLQSAYKTNHSTETALIKVQNDILRAIDDGNSVILLLLDISAAFDTIDHEILLYRLCSRYGITGKAYEWFKSYLTGRTFTVQVAGGQSSERALLSGVPQGSILGPILFSMYLAPLGELMRSQGIKYHLYADDTQLYVTFKSSDPGDLETAKSKIEICVRDVDKWMTCNRLKLNSDKTEVVILSARHRPSPCLQSLVVCDDAIRPSSKARNIGVMMDSSLFMEEHVTNVCKSGFFHLRKISKIRKYLSFKSAETLVHALVTSRLDFGNALLFGLPDNLLERIQKVQNAAARIVTLTRKRDHITPVLFKLHWLPIKERIIYKILLTTYKALNGLAPPYISELLDIYAPKRNLRSLSDKKLVVPRYKLCSYGYRSFSVSAPFLWNSLPQDIRLCETLDCFKNKLKTHLFRHAYASFL